MITGHGGEIHDAAARAGCRPADIVDMSSNINPLGPPAGLIDYLKDNIEVAGGFSKLAGKVWRIGLMGFNSRPENVMLLLDALGRVLN